MILDTFIEFWYVIFLFLIVAILYASAGFGGVSSYLAILALTGLAYTEIRAISILCNILVVSGNVLFYYQKKSFDFKKIIPLVILSVPLAYLGGYIKITQSIFFILFGFTLLFAAITMWISNKILSDHEISTKPNLKKNLFYGGFIGFISGMVGIGGGIFLAPLLHLTNWDTPKKIAATASIFILLNSLAGFGGQISNPDFSINWNLTFILLVSVFIGGQVGIRISSKFFTPIFMKRATAILIAFVSLRILWKYLF